MEPRRADQDPEYLRGAHAVVAEAITTALDDDEIGRDLASAVLAVLAESGWHLITAEDAEKMAAAYVLQELRG